VARTEAFTVRVFAEFLLALGAIPLVVREIVKVIRRTRAPV